MTSSGEGHAWSKTAHGEISVVRPVEGMELLSLREWKQPWSSSLSAVGLAIPESTASLQARVAGVVWKLKKGSVLFIPAGEPYSLDGGPALTVSIVSIEPTLLQSSQREPSQDGQGARVITAAGLYTALRRLLARVTAGTGPCEHECASVLFELASTTLMVEATNCK